LRDYRYYPSALQPQGPRYLNWGTRPRDSKSQKPTGAMQGCDTHPVTGMLETSARYKYLPLRCKQASKQASSTTCCGHMYARCLTNLGPWLMFVLAYDAVGPASKDRDMFGDLLGVQVVMLLALSCPCVSQLHCCLTPKAKV